jgi:DNA polymerase III epsilon subunit-like protein
MTKTYQANQKYVLCVDWETSGAVFGGDSSQDHQGLSFGAIVANATDFTPVEKLYRMVKFNPEKYKWTDAAEKIHGLTREHLEEYGISQEDAAIDLAQLILKYWGPDSKVMFLGHNPEFDRRFTNQLLNVIDIEFSIERENAKRFESWIQLHHVMLDTSALGFITMGLFKSDLLFAELGFPPREKHNALSDAEMTLEVCAVMKELVKMGLAAAGT